MSKSIVSVLRAIEQSDAEQIRQELAAGGLPADGTPECRFLHYAIIRGLHGPACALLDSGADPRLMDEETGLTPLMQAAAHGRAPLVERLLPLSDPLQTDAKRGWSALFHAAANAHDRNGACVWLLAPVSDLTLIDNQGLNALHVAARAGSHEALPLLVEKIDLSLRDNHGKTALHWAARAVLAPKADSKARMGLICLEKKMSAQAANIQDKTGRTAAMALAEGGELALAESMAREADLSLETEEGKTLLMIVAKRAPHHFARDGSADTPYLAQQRWRVLERLAMRATDEQIERIAGFPLRERHAPRLRSRLEGLELRKAMALAAHASEPSSSGEPPRAATRRI